MRQRCWSRHLLKDCTPGHKVADLPMEVGVCLPVLRQLPRKSTPLRWKPQSPNCMPKARKMPDLN